ncbi:CLUMA_CG018816, isoform A [Clunio marinus]|uniref:CLUMA_CG018816, isoform A n=1 Tax=Clunio marinus TaxID=568069 RepID=A0A1J1J1Z6_9DIPT|nr:CLUMA_CG018816, isoform A [Clunio marinus]
MRWILCNKNSSFPFLFFLVIYYRHVAIVRNPSAQQQFTTLCSNERDNAVVGMLRYLSTSRLFILRSLVSVISNKYKQLPLLLIQYYFMNIECR